MTATTKLTQECIYEKKVAEIKSKQAISAQNGAYKVQKLQDAEEKAAKAAALRAEKKAATAAQQAKYANKR